MMDLAFRLDSAFPSLAESFRRASSIKRRRAAVIACEMAISSVDLANQEIGLVLDALRAGSAVDTYLQQWLEIEVARFDDEYLRLADDEGHELKKNESLQVFSKARAVSALAFAITADSGELHEAIYEAIMSLSDPDELVRNVQIALR